MGKKIALFAFCVLCITFALIGCGGGGGGGDTGNPVGPTAVTGSVANLSGTVKFSDMPLADAAVYLYKSEKALQAGVSSLYALRGSILAQTKLAEGSYSTKTDSQGRYSFTAIPVGEYTLIAVKDETHQFAQTGVMLGSVTEQDAQLTPTGKVSGRLLLSSGQPARGAIVHLEKTSYVAISDVNGDFTINHVPAGQNFVLGIVSTLGTLQNPVTVNIAPAEDRQLGNLTLTIPVQQVSTINGSVSAADNSVPTSALSGKMVVVVPAGGDLTPFIALTDSSGNFSLNVKTVSSYNVSVVGGEFAVAPGVQTVAVSTLGTTVTVPQPFVLSKPTVVLPPNTQFYTYSGTINKRSKAFNEPDNAGVPLTLTSTDAAANVFSAVTSPTGSFTFSVPAGTYNLAVGGGYALETTFANPLSISAPTVLNNVIWVVPTQVFTASFLVSGNLTKVPVVNGETDQGNVMVTLTPTTGDAVTFAGTTTPTGSFAIRVPAGTYNMSVVSSIYRPESTLAQVVVTSADVTVPSFNLQPIQAPVVVYTVDGAINKTAFIDGETDNGGVIITLTNTDASAKLYSAVTTAGGTFSFKVEPGIYTLAINSGYKFATTFSNPVDASAGNVSISPVIDIVPLATKMFTLSGDINKVVRKAGESNDGDVTVTIRSDAATFMPQTAVTEVSGNFAFKVPAGNYAIEVSSGYDLVSRPPGFPYTVTNFDLAIAPIDVRPVGVVPANIGGSVTPANPNNHYRVRIEKTDGSYTDNETTAGAFYFNNLAPGEYKIVVLPDANGYYVESALLNVAEGENLTGVSLAPTPVAPMISTVSATENVLTIIGSNFESLPVDTALTKILVDGNPRNRPAAFTPTDAQEQAMIVSVAPGQHNVVIEKRWTRPGTTEIFFLKSAPVTFNKIMGSPLNVKVDDITDVGARISWTNANLTSKSIVGVFQVSNGSQAASVALDGTSFQVTGLFPATDYVAHVYNRYGDVESTPTSVNFTTRSNVNFGISSFALPNTNYFRSGSLFGFEVVNGVAYVGSLENDSINIFIRSYNLTTGAQVATATISSSNSMSRKSISMTSASTGQIFLQFNDNIGTGTVYINCFSSTLGTPIASASIPAGDYGYEEAQLVYADNRLFSAATRYNLSQPPYYASTDLMYFNSPDTAAGLSAPQFFFNKTDENRPSSAVGLAMMNAKITADANSLYLAVASFSMNIPSEPGTIDIKRFAFSNLANPVNIKTIDTGNTSMVPAIEQIVVGGGRLYMIADVSGNRHFHINLQTVYAEDFSWSNRGNYSIDGKGRVWLGQISMSGSSFVQLDSSMKVEKYLPVKYFASDDGMHPVPGEFIKTDQTNGSFYMLHYNNADNLAVYFYPSSY